MNQIYHNITNLRITNREIKKSQWTLTLTCKTHCMINCYGWSSGILFVSIEQFMIFDNIYESYMFNIWQHVLVVVTTISKINYICTQYVLYFQKHVYSNICLLWGNDPSSCLGFWQPHFCPSRGHNALHNPKIYDNFYALISISKHLEPHGIIWLKPNRSIIQYNINKNRAVSLIINKCKLMGPNVDHAKSKTWANYKS